MPYCSKLIKEDLLEKSHLNSIKSYYKEIEKHVIPLIDRHLMQVRSKNHESEAILALRYLDRELKKFL